MECVLIPSKLITSVAYYENEQRLCVWFQTGRSAWHDNISHAMFRNLVDADSPGFYYNTYIRGRSGPSPRRSRWQFSRLIAAVFIAAGMVTVSGLFTTTPHSADLVADSSQDVR